MKMSEEARKARNKYFREWRQKNPEKWNATVERYWLKKAEEEKQNQEK